MTAMHCGSCLCGETVFEVHGPLRHSIACHCTQCRKQTGHFYAATNVDAKMLDIEGEDAITWYAASPQARRGFCRTCGSALFWREHNSDWISILAGLFDQPTGLVGGYHIFVADKGDYYVIPDEGYQRAGWE